MSRVMNKVEVIVKEVSWKNRDKRFIEWIDGWIRGKYKVVDKVKSSSIDLIFTIEGDMFELFVEMHRMVERMMYVLHADVPIAICSSDECIDLSRNDDYDFVVLMSKYKIKKLKKVRNLVRRLLVGDDLYGIFYDVHVVGIDGRIRLITACHDVVLYVDEAIVLSEILIDRVYTNTRLMILRKVADEIFKMFKRAEVDLRNIDIEDVDHGFRIVIDGCKMYLDYNETLWLVYKLLTWSIVGLKKSLESVDEYGIDVESE